MFRGRGVMNFDAADAIALIGLLQHDTLGSNTLSAVSYTHLTTAMPSPTDNADRRGDEAQ